MESDTDSAPEHSESIRDETIHSEGPQYSSSEELPVRDDEPTKEIVLDPQEYFDGAERIEYKFICYSFYYLLKDLLLIPKEEPYVMLRGYVFSAIFIVHLCIPISFLWYLVPLFFPSDLTFQRYCDFLNSEKPPDPKEFDGSVAPDDASTSASTISTMSEKEVAIPEQLVKVRKMDSPEMFINVIENALGKTSCAMSLSKFLLAIYVQPSSNCVVTGLHYASALHTLIKEAAMEYPDKVKSAIRFLSKQTEALLGAPLVCESTGDSFFSFENSWLDGLAKGFERLEFIKDAPVGKLMSTVLSLICTVPLLFSKIATADTWAKQWKLTTDAISLAGTSMTSLLKTMIGMQQEMTELSAAGCTPSMMSILVAGSSIHKEYVECRNIASKLRTGLITLNVVELDELTRRCDRLAKTASGRIGPKSTIHDLNLEKECIELADSLVIWTVAQKERVVPFVFSLDGPPGNGKSTFARDLFPILHEWFDMKEIISVSTPTLTTRTDEVSTNRTTLIFLDDTANAKNAQKSPMEFLIDNVNNSYREIVKADLPDKGKHVYRNRFVCLADNIPTRGVDEELRCPQAGLRRFGCCLEVQVRPEYDNGSGGVVQGFEFNLGFAQRFRPYIWVKEGAGPSKQRNVFGGDGFVDNISAIAWLKDEAIKHFDQQRKRVAAHEKMGKETLCPNCKLVPFSCCKCLDTDEAFLDASEDSAEAMQAEAFGTFAQSISSVVSEFDVFDRMLVRYRLFVDSLHRDCAEKIAFLESNIFSVLILGTGIVISATLAQIAHFSIGILSMLLFILVSECRRRVMSRLHTFATVTAPDLIQAHSASLRTTVEEYGKKMVMFGMAAYFASVFMDYLQKRKVKMVAESHTESLSVNPVVSDGPRYAPVVTTVLTPQTESDPGFVAKVKGLIPIWKPLSSGPSVPNPPVETKTITLEDLKRLTIANTWSGGFRPVGHPEVPMQDVHLFFVKGGYALTVSHSQLYQGELLASVFEKDGVSFVLPAGATYQFPGLDLQLIDLNNLVAPRKDLTKFFLEEVPPGDVVAQKLVSENGKYVFRGSVMRPKKSTYNLLTRHTAPGKEVKTQPQLMFHTVGSSIQTQAGYCGMPYIVDSVARGIFAIHCSGNQADKSGAVPFTRKMIEQAIKVLVSRGNLVRLEKAPMDLSAGRMTAEGAVDTKHPIFRLPNDGRTIRCEKWVPKHFSTRSSLVCNPHLQKAKDHLGLKVLKRRPKMSVQEAGYPVLESATRPKPFGNKDHLFLATEIIMKEIIDPIMTAYTPAEHETRPLTYSEILNGIEGHFPCLDLNKSSGIGGKKRDYVTGELPERQLTKEMELDCDAIEKMITQSKNPCLPAVACIKDEPISPHKTARLFYNPPMQLYMVIAKYMKNVLDVITKNAVGFKTAIGLDPVGPEWENFVKMFSAPHFRNNCFDLDFEKFDTTQNIVFRNFVNVLCMRIARHLYKNENDLEMLRKAMALGDETPIDFLGVVLFLEDLLVSGMIFTAHKNGIVIILLMAISYIRFCHEKKIDCSEYKFLDCFAMGGLGDDSVGAVSDFFREAGWTQEHLVDVAKKYGMRLTAADKSDVFRFKTFPECEFLKRYYNWHPDLEANVAVASPKSYLRPFHLHQPSKEMTEAEYQCEQTRTAMLEAFYGGRACYEELQKRFHAYFDNAPNTYKDAILFTPYEEVLAERKPFYDPQKRLFDVQDVGMKLLQEYDSLEHIPYVAESEVEEETSRLIGTIEGEEQDTAGYVANDVQHLPLNPESIADQFLLRRQAIREIKLPLIGIDTFCPQVEMAKQKIFETRSTNTAHLTTGVKLTFVATAPGTVTGCLLACISYGPDREGDLDPNSQSLHCLMSQRPHIQLRIGEQSNVWELTVPFVSPYHSHLSHDFNEELKPSVSVSQLVPLTTSGTEANPITIRIYGEFVSFSLYGATASHSATAESGRHTPLHITDLGPDQGDSVIASSSIMDVTDPAEMIRRHEALERYKREMEEIIFFQCDIRTFLEDLCYIPSSIPHCDGYCYLQMFTRRLRPLVALYHGPFPKASTFEWTRSLGREWMLLTSIIQNADGSGHVSATKSGLGFYPFEYVQFPGTLGASKCKSENLRKWKGNIALVFPPHSPIAQYAATRNYIPAGDWWKSSPGFCYLCAFHPVVRPLVAAYHQAYPFTAELDYVRHMDEEWLLPVELVSSEDGFIHIKAAENGCQITELLEEGACIGGEKISTKIKRATNMANDVLNLPLISATPLSGLKTPVEIVKQFGNALQLMGFSKPVSHSNGRPSAYFPNAAGDEYADVLAAQPSCEVSPSLPTGSGDEMNFANISRKWTFATSFTVQPTPIVGRVEWTMNVTPQIIVGQRPAACAGPGLFHSFYRGAMEYRFEVFCPLLVSIRLGIFYDPLGFNQADLGDSPRLPEEDFLEHYIWDSSNSQVFEMTVGHSSRFPALQTYHPSWSDPVKYETQWHLPGQYQEECHNGHITVKLIDYVNGGNAAPMPIYVNVWARAGEDMQWGRYTGQLPGNYSMQAIQEPAPTMDERTCVAGMMSEATSCESATPAPFLTPPKETPQPTLIQMGSQFPSTAPSASEMPSKLPSVEPSEAPSQIPSLAHSEAPSEVPSAKPSKLPSATPSSVPSEIPSVTSSEDPSSAPSVEPSGLPSEKPSYFPSFRPSFLPSFLPSMKPTTAVKARGAPGIIASTTEVQGPYWFDASNVNRGEMALAYTSDAQLRIGCVVPDQFGNRTVGISCRALTGTCTIEGVTVPTTTDTLLFYPTTSIVNLNLTVSPGGELRIYSGVVYTAFNVALRTMPPAGPPVSLGGSPEVFARYVPSDWYFPSDLSNYVQPQQVATVTWIGTLIVSWNGGSNSFTSATWNRRSVGYAAGLRIRSGNISSYIYSVTYLRNADENSIEDHSPARRLRAEANVIEEATLVPTSKHFGGPLDKSEYFIRALVGEQNLSFRELLKIPFPTVVFEPISPGEFTSLSEIDVPSGATLENTSLFNFLLHAFHGWRGGIVFHYVLNGDGMVEVTRALRGDRFTPFVMGDSFTNAYAGPRLSVVFPWQEPNLFSNGVSLPSIVKVVKISKFSGDHFRVREFRSTAEDFSFHYFRGLPRLWVVNP
jgi:hypothetical protein